MSIKFDGNSSGINMSRLSSPESSLPQPLNASDLSSTQKTHSIAITVFSDKTEYGGKTVAEIPIHHPQPPSYRSSAQYHKENIQRAISSVVDFIKSRSKKGKNFLKHKILHESEQVRYTRQNIKDLKKDLHQLKKNQVSEENDLSIKNTEKKIALLKDYKNVLKTSKTHNLTVVSETLNAKFDELNSDPPPLFKETTVLRNKVEEKTKLDEEIQTEERNLKMFGKEESSDENASKLTEIRDRVNLLKEKRRGLEVERGIDIEVSNPNPHHDTVDLPKHPPLSEEETSSSNASKNQGSSNSSELPMLEKTKEKKNLTSLFEFNSKKFNLEKMQEKNDLEALHKLDTAALTDKQIGQLQRWHLDNLTETQLHSLDLTKVKLIVLDVYLEVGGGVDKITKQQADKILNDSQAATQINGRVVFLHPLANLSGETLMMLQEKVEKNSSTKS